MTCLITGCALVDLDTHKCVWGDLHRIGDAWVFNPVLENGETAWQTGAEFCAPSSMRQLVLSAQCPPAGYFERRGVIVIGHDWAHLNQVALDYLGGRA